MTRRIVTAFLFTLVIATGFVAGRATADQPKMHDALEHLRAAKANLEAATADKGGHREAAIRLVNEAIGEVEKGISYDRRH